MRIFAQSSKSWKKIFQIDFCGILLNIETFYHGSLDSNVFRVSSKWCVIFSFLFLTLPDQVFLLSFDKIVHHTNIISLHQISYPSLFNSWLLLICRLYYWNAKVIFSCHFLIFFWVKLFSPSIFNQIPHFHTLPLLVYPLP